MRYAAAKRDGPRWPSIGAGARHLHGLLCLILALFATATHGLDPDKALHQYVTGHWKLDAGLPQIQVTALTQGPQGYLWIGTRGGLARFDGVSFRTYVPDDTPALQGMIVRSLHTDRRGRLWIGTYKGVTLYSNGTFRTVPVQSSEGRGEPGITHHIDVRDIAELADGTVIVASNQGLFASTGQHLTRWRDAAEPAHALLARDDALWVGELGRVRIFEGDVTVRALPEQRRNTTVTALISYRGDVWAGTGRGLLRWNGQHWATQRAPTRLADDPVDALFVDRDDVLWVAGRQGLVRLQGRRPLASDQRRYPDVLAITEDHEGNLWLGIDTSGLVRLHNGWTKRYSVPEGLHDPTVWSLMEGADGAIWVGTTQGLSRFRNGRFELMASAEALPHPGVYTLLVERDRVWLGTRAGLALFADGRIDIPPGTAALADAQISSIVPAAGDGYWLATSKGLCRYRQPTLRCFGREAGLREERLRLLLTTRDGRLLVGSQAGLFEFDGERFHELGTGVISAEDDITALDELADGTLVAGTLSEVLYVDAGTGWNAFTHQDGLPVNSPFFSALDGRGDLWVAGLQGLYRVPFGQLEDLRRGRIDSLDARMLLNERGDVRGAQQEFCCNGAGRAKGFIRDGVLWLPTRDGIIAVNTDAVGPNPQPPNVVIERVRTSGRWQDFAGGALVLPADARDFAARFTALSFQAPESVLFRYRLMGFDETWQTPDDVNRRAAYYTNLPPGSYRFQVRAANNTGVWRPQAAELAITVEPYFFETGAFYALVALAMAGAIYGGFRLLLRNQRRQRERLRALVDARTEELRIANEHLREYSRRLEEASRTDPLTGLWNRRYLEEQLPVDMAVFDRKLEGAADLGLAKVFAVVDLDFFKDLNDRHGHTAGDQVLREFGALVSGLLRPGDYVVRWGGEEFVIVLREIAPETAEAVLQRILEAVAAHPFRVLDGVALHITCSIGYALYPCAAGDGRPTTWRDTVELADRALYAAKEAGRDRCVRARPEPAGAAADGGR